MNYIDHEWVLEQSRMTGFSIPTIHSLIELSYITCEDSINLEKHVDKLILALRTPQKWFSVRVNPIRDKESERDLKKLIIRHLDANPNEILPNLFFLPVMGPFILEKQPREIVVDKFAAEAVMTGANLYVPGFIKPLPKFHSGEHFSIYGPNHTHVANGITRLSYKEIQGLKKGIGIETTDSVYRIPSYRDSEYYLKGNISDHSFGPFLACNLLMEFYHPENTPVILDVCSAPGHKTCALSEIVYSKYSRFPKIFSIDRSSKRLESLKKDIQRLGLENIRVVSKRFEKLAKSKPEFLNSADFLILDPPCSALGTRPKIAITHTQEDFRSFFLLQRRLVKEIPKFLKEDGILLYTTCTLTVLENECVVGIMKNKFGFELLNAHKLLLDVFNAGGMESMRNEIMYGIYRNEEKLKTIPFVNNQHLKDIERYLTLTPEDSRKVIRINPIGGYSTGYFIALLRKKTV